MFNTELGYFCATHDNWAELLSMEPYFLKIKEDGPYVMFSYDQIRSCFMYEIVREARGIIFRKASGRIPYAGHLINLETMGKTMYLI